MNLWSAKGSIAATLLLAACAQDNAPATPSFTVTDSAGIRIVTNDIPVALLRPLITEDSARFVSIGVVSGEEPYMFNGISDVTRLASGHIVITDETQQLRVFDSTGKHVVSYGGKGQGPGEFLSISDLVAQAGDTLLVWDAHAMRHSSFSVSKGFLERAAVRRKNLSDLLIRDFYYEHIYPVADGSLIVEVTPRRSYADVEAQRPVGEFMRFASTLVWVDTSFASYRTLGDHGGIEQIKLMVAGKPEYFVPPGSAWPHQSIGGNPPRICVDGMRGPQIDCFDADGTSSFIRWNYTPVAFQPDWRDTWIKMETSRTRSRVTPEQTRAAIMSAPALKEQPPVGWLHVDALGFVWVASGHFPSQGGPPRWRLFDRKGELVGYAAAGGFQIKEIGEDYMLGIAYTREGVERVLLRGLRRVKQ